MRFGLLRDTSNQISAAPHAALIDMPLRLGPDLVEAAFVGPLERDLAAEGIGRVTGHEIVQDTFGEPVALRLELRLESTTREVLETIADALERLDAPAGSTIGGGAEVIEFGTCEGLGLYLPARETDYADRLAVAEACTDAMGGAGVYQGSFNFGDRTALYFYGDSFNRMRAAITFLIGHDPRCRKGYVRRLG